MTTPADREAVRLDLAAYVNGQLDAGRAAEVRRALECDPVLRADLASVEDVALRLFEAAAVSDPTTESLPPFDESLLPARDDVPYVPGRGARSRRTGRWAGVAAMSGAAALVVALVAAVVLTGPRDLPSGDVTAAPGGAPSVRLAVVDAKVAGASAVATMQESDGRRTMQLTTAGLPAAPPDHHYEVWLMRDGTPTPVGRLDAASAELALPDGVDGGWDAVDVSIEADDGDPAHSGDSVLRGPIA